MQVRKQEQSVLIVDDDRFILATTRVVLEHLGFEHILSADCAGAALDHLASANPPVGLVLSDLNMPDVDGVELLRLIDAQGYDGDIVLFSGEDERTLSMAANLARARKLSVLGAISKPLQATALADLLAKQPSRPIMRSRAATPEVTPEMLSAAIDAEVLVPWYQPKIEIETLTVVGFEALIRWPRAQGMIFPDTFIPIAEKHDLIDALTQLLIKQVVRMGLRWRAQGLTTKVAINVSMDSLHDLDFPNRLERLIKSEHGEDLTLQLEVTESRLMEDLVSPLDILLRLRLKKIRLSIDDFGTGHSNIGQLRDLPFDELKLDRSYVQAAANDPRAMSILQSTVDMGRKLNMTIVAEGIETLEDWLRVARLGCDQVQGYFISRPIPGEDVPRWMANWPALSRTLFV